MINSSQLTWADLGVTYDGPHATPHRVASGPYFLNISSLNDGRLDLSQSDHVSSEDFTKWTRRVTPRADDLLFSYETRLGEAALMPDNIEACLGRRMALLRPNRDIIHPKFMLYYFLSPAFQRMIEQNTIYGATVNRISLSTIGKWPVSIPPLKEQQAIADVLSALDDKIISNSRAIDKIPPLLQAIFRSLVSDSEAKVPFGELATVTKGVSYKSIDLQPSTTALVTLKSFVRTGGYSSRGLKDYSGPHKASQVISPGELVVAQTDLTQAAEVVGRAVRVPKSEEHSSLVASLDVSIVRPIENIPNEFVLGVMLAGPFREHCKANTSGTTVLHLRRNAMESYLAPRVSSKTQHNFAEIARPLLNTIDSLEAESTRLSKLRDTLLPQLMSGTLRVKNAEAVIDSVVL